MTENGAGTAERRRRFATLWREHRARWTLPLVIIVIIGLVAILDHLGSHRISQVDAQKSVLVAATGGESTVELSRPWDGFNPNTPEGAASSTPTLLSSVLPSAYVIDSSLVAEVNSNLLSSVEVTSTSPLTIQYVINPMAVWSDGVPVTADDFIYAWESQRGTGVDIDGRPDQFASSLGYRDVASVTGSPSGKTVTVVFATPFTDWRVMFDHMVPAHIARRVGWNHGFDVFNPAIDISAGPMEVQSVSGHTAVLVRNPKWWGTPSILDRVTVTIAPNQESWVNQLAANNKAVAQPSTFDLGTLGSVSSLPNTQSAVKPSLNLVQLEFNVTSPVTMRAAARQAIAHAIDRNALLTRTFGSIDPTLAVNQDHLATASQASYEQSSAAGEYSAPDLPTTDHLLKSIGFHQDPAGNYVDDAGKQLTLRMAVEIGDPWISQLAVLISSQLRSAGIAVVTVPVDGAEGVPSTGPASSYDVALVNSVSSPFQSVTAAWFSDGLGIMNSSGSENWSKLDDPQVDQLFIEAAQSLNPVSGGSIYAQIDDQLWDQMVALPLFAEPALVANGVQLANIQYNASVDGILWNVPLWTTLKPGPASR